MRDRRSVRLLSTVLLGSLLSIWVSPSIASEISSQQWVQNYQLLPFIEEDSLEGAQPLSRKDFVISIVSFYDNTEQFISVGNETAEEYERVHFQALDDMHLRIEWTREEADRLIAEAETLTKQQTKQQDKRQRVKVDLEDAAAEESAQFLKAEFGIDMTMAEGSFQLEEALNEEDYIRYLRQAEALTADVWFNSPSLTGMMEMSRLEIELRHGDIRSANSSLLELLNDYDQVNELVDELRTALNQNEALASRHDTSTQDDSTVQRASSHKSLGLMIKAGDISQIPDISPTDEIFLPLDRLANTIGVDVVQPDGRFNGQAAITRGEFARYMLEVMLRMPYMSNTVAALHQASYIREEMREELQTIEQDLRQAIAQINSR